MAQPEALADGAAIGSMLIFLGMSLVQWNVVVHIAAGVVAILAGILAITFHVLKIREHKYNNKRK